MQFSLKHHVTEKDKNTGKDIMVMIPVDMTLTMDKLTFAFHAPMEGAKLDISFQAIACVQMEPKFLHEFFIQVGINTFFFSAASDYERDMLVAAILSNMHLSNYALSPHYSKSPFALAKKAAEA